MLTHVPKTVCIHCGVDLETVKSNKDHVPSRSLLSGSPPPDLPVIRICEACNSSFSSDEPYLVSFLGLIAEGSARVNKKAWGHASKVLDSDFRLQDDLDARLSVVNQRDGGQRVAVEPDAGIINRVIEKNARGHIAIEAGLTARSDPKISFASLQSLPPAGRELFHKGPSWRVVEPDLYRYVVITEPILIVRAVIWEFLATEAMWPA
ncbi:hypothetical protein [Salipiger bermudensis]|uniref:hypothetical protein n=1 Tax=Salipiger bermudensis TaxID=344736 RepID=UPI001CD459B6|nr:hypothetical protein [Salipiger bermudensis]MCA0961971.1 hypothetical protein [Salipiger bermudensis]